MIATNEALDVLRHGWHDAASTLAADVPEVADLLHARLEIAISTERLDERSLLDTIQEVESLTSRAGSPSSLALARRLRRTVYEYLLALDAARPSETNAASLERPVTTTDGPMVGAEEVAALGHAAKARAEGAAETADAPDDDDSDDEGGDAAAEGPGASRRFGLRRRQRRAGEASPDAPGGDEPTAGEPVEAEPAGESPEGGGDAEQAAADPIAEAGPPAADAAAPEADSFVAPRAGFHIVEDTPAHRTVEPDAAGFEMPVFSADEPSPAPTAEPAPEVAAAAHPDPGFVTWEGPNAATEPAPDQGAPVADLGPTALLPTGPAEAAPAAPPPAAPGADHPGAVVPEFDAAISVQPTPSEVDDLDAEPRGWGVRRPGEARPSRNGPRSAAMPVIEDDPFENNARLAELRRRIEDRLRRKRCDEAAALLQELAQETGGRSVAELAMNAGDRCRALGKSNAALNCYLAAARADPVYELPLSRLADICIDNQDTELAVSYLERIARLYRYRGDETAALRVYRRIATIAPQREDVLNLLMNAQRTGRLE